MIITRDFAMPIIRAALNEDIGHKDVTTDNIIDGNLYVKAEIVAKDNCILAGIDIAKWVFQCLERYRYLKFNSLAKDGESISKNKRIAIFEANARAVLKGERTALNFLSRLSGIATLTNEYVKKTRPSLVKIMDTRKTTPGLRYFEKYAVNLGGGFNHRMNLSEMILIKENHIQIKSFEEKANTVKDIIDQARNKTKGKMTEVEVRNLNEFKHALDAEPDIIMLDNMSAPDAKKAVVLRNNLSKNVLIEYSGGISLNNVKRIAKTGVDIISVGALTHSAPAIDFSLDIIAKIPRPRRNK